MRAGAIVHHYGPDPASIGGMESVIATLTEHSIGADRVYAHVTWTAGRPWMSAAQGVHQLAALARVPSEDIVHVHLSERGSFLREGAILWLAARRGHPTVASIHGAEFLSFFGRHPKLVHAVLSRADVITCLSEDVVEAARRAAPDSQIELLPNPVADPGFQACAGDTPPLVLFAGELGTRKGADTLVDAWPLVRRESRDARCLMVGPKTDLRLPELPGLTVMHDLPRTEIARLVAEARVIALPSRAEGMPMILIEALAAGRPFVATPVGGIPDLAHTMGMLVPVDDVDELARSLVRFLADRRLADDVGAAGRDFWQRTRSVVAIDHRLAAIYAKASDGSRRRRSADGKLLAVELCGLAVAPFGRSDLEDLVLRELEETNGGWIVTANLDILRQCAESREATELIAAADLVIGDGMPLVWASRLAGTPLPERVAGSDLIWTLSRKAGEHGRSIYLLGGRPGSAERAAELIQLASPGLRVAGWDCPPFGFEHSDQTVAAVVSRVQAADPDILYVGLGFPKQERLIERIREVAPHCWCIGVGAGIDLASGQIRRAPRLAQRLGCEWLFRFLQEPRRLGNRYFIHDLPYAARLFGWALWRRGVAGTNRHTPSG